MEEDVTAGVDMLSNQLLGVGHVTRRSEPKETTTELQEATVIDHSRMITFQFDHDVQDAGREGENHDQSRSVLLRDTSTIVSDILFSPKSRMKKTWPNKFLGAHTHRSAIRRRVGNNTVLLALSYVCGL